MKTPVRTANLQLLVKEFGRVEVIADLSGVSDSYLKEILRGGKLPSGSIRGVGNNVARNLENGCNKPPFWMDESHEASNEATQELSPFERELITRFRKANDDLRHAILTVARLAG